ncbi:cysteine proteinase [Durotheca rogersii]|uniref:cysteine proteinase n=1 Tax=Durotheca rogersii TaxID=419775 RepID=UPI00221FEBD8|nr:cysteine proteinase [Durotheca rogersii]KAI5863904.1 cysteine proteinase [Durotheca rogersii]
MSSGDNSDRAAELRQEQRRAIHNLQLESHPRALTSPRILRRFLESRLHELLVNCDCNSHEMLLISTQSFRDADTAFVSTFCGRCRYHFHVRSNFKHARPYDEVHHLMHMLIPSAQRSEKELQAERAGYDDTIGYAKFICAVDECLFNIEISVMPPKILLSELRALNDNSRVAHNLKLAREEDEQRYSDVSDDYGIGTTSVLNTYLNDALQHTGERPLRIKKRNKKFRVTISTDFDPLLRRLGFYEGNEAETDEACWFITTPKEERDPTPVQTLRALMEDAQAELEAILCFKSKPAWDPLVAAFQGDYLDIALDPNQISRISETDLDLLGCLVGYPPRHFSWAAILLAGLKPQFRDRYLDAGLRCILDRSVDASTDIVMYKSQFDELSSMERRIREAFDFFKASPEDGLTSIWFIQAYDAMTKANCSDDYKAQAEQHLEVIGNYLDRDILSEITSQAPNHPVSPVEMSYSTAAGLLGVETHYTAEIISEFVGRILLDDTTDRVKVVEALNVLSEYKSQQNEADEAKSLRELAEIVAATEGAPTLVPEPQSSVQQTSSLATPPGLKNIGNTCYLNSLLQYFYNVKVVRDLVLDFDQAKLDLDEETIGRRRTGGNGTSVSLEEAIVARQFVEMLRDLFTDLQTTTNAAAQPSQKLANTALSSARDILDRRSQNKPPPLPARPSPAPPTLPQTSDTDAVNNAVNITVETVNPHHEVTSSRSSQTLVDEGDDTTMSYTQSEIEEVKESLVKVFEGSAPSSQFEGNNPSVPQSRDATSVQNSSEPLSLDERIAQVSRRLEHSDRSGTTQEDVGEIIGYILEHFMRAIRPDGPMPDKPELQADKITDTFFTTIVNSTVKTQKGYPTSALASRSESPLNVEIVPERWITAYPDGTNNVKCTLFEALDRYFSYELIGDGNHARYSSIRTLPPIVHICIQRTTQRGKNENPVIIPEILFLDRYMESEEDSQLWLTRKRAWALKERLKELEVEYTHNIQADPEKLRAITSAKDAEYRKYGEPVVQEGHEEFEKQRVHRKPQKLESMDTSEIAAYIAKAPPDIMDQAPTGQTILEDIPRGRKRRLANAQENGLSKRVAVSPSSTEDLTKVEFAESTWEANKPLEAMTRAELVDLRQREEKTFEAMTNEKYSLHAVICHSGGATAGHYWVWIRDFKRNVWYRYNDETVTEDTRGSEAVLKDLNDSGNPYYVAYVRDELRDQLVDVPQRCRPEAGDFSDAGPEVEMIEGVVPEPVEEAPNHQSSSWPETTEW